MKSFEEYLKENLDRDLIDHSVRCIKGPEGEIDFYIHPAGADGQTMDLTVHGNNLSTIPADHAAGSRPAKQEPPDGFQRRSCLYLMSPTELAIYEAMSAVERAGADIRLTDAVNLLQQARDKVADFVDGVD